MCYSPCVYQPPSPGCGDRKVGTVNVSSALVTPGMIRTLYRLVWFLLYMNPRLHTLKHTMEHLLIFLQSYMIESLKRLSHLIFLQLLRTLCEHSFLPATNYMVHECDPATNHMSMICCQKQIIGALNPVNNRQDFMLL